MGTEPKYPYWPDLTDEEGDILKAYFDAECGDCVEGRCHWGSDAYRAAHPEAREENCGCARHAESVAARPFQASHAEHGDRCVIETAKAWHAARFGVRYAVIRTQIVGSPDAWSHSYTWDGVLLDVRESAQEHGWGTLDHDDFSIGTVKDGRLIAFGFGQHDWAPEDRDDLGEIARQIGLQGPVAG